MKDLITEARELCELRRKQKHIPMSMLDKMLELCDALEKATQNNDELIRELAQLARESVERDMALARLEAEVEAIREAQRWRELEEEPCGDIGRKALLYGIGGVDEGEYLGEGDWKVEYGVVPGETFTHWMPLPAPPEEGAEK